MNKRCLVNVATGEFYCKMQDRLIKSFEKSVDNVWVNDSSSPYRVSKDEVTAVEQEPSWNRTGIDLKVWRNVLPPGSRPHSESPYGFKVHAIKAASEMGYTSILWLDSPAYAVKEDISPIFDKIEKEGYYAMSHIDPLENYIPEGLLPFYGRVIEDLKGLNLPSGSCYGFDLSQPIIKQMFGVFCEEEMLGSFKRPSPHRHDETILAILLKCFEKEVFTFDPLFQSDSPECLIYSGDGYADRVIKGNKLK